MIKTIAIILGAFIIMAVPIISLGSDSATTIKTEVIYQPGDVNLSTAVAVTVPCFYDQFSNFNYVSGPILATSSTAKHIEPLHSRWYIDIQYYTSSGYDNINYLYSAKPNGPHTNNLNYWSWSGCV